MSIDLGRELTVRCIAHNIGRRFPNRDTDRGLVVGFALQLADLMTADSCEVAHAAVVLWQATDDPAPLQVSLSVHQPQGEAHA